MFVRYASAIASGTAMTLALLFVMHLLISLKPVNRPPIDTRELVFNRTIPNEDTTIVDPIAEYPELKDPVPPKPRSTTDLDFDSGTGIGVSQAPQIPGNDMPTLGIGMSDSPLVAFIRVQPNYPPSAAERELDGWVIVEFDVLPDGSVTNVSIVESSHRLFESAAIKAAQRFRFRAKVVDGVPQSTRGVRNKFTFQIERG